MKRLAGSMELLDGPLDTATLEGNLRDLTRVNKWLGGSALSWRALAPFLSTDAPTTLLDVGTGAADIPKDLLRRARARRLSLEIRATDVRAEIVELARRGSGGIAGLRVDLAGGDSNRLDEPGGAYDIVHSSMVFHHLEPRSAVRMLGEMARVCRRAVIVNDLERGRASWLSAWLLTRVATGNRYTRHDAPLSVRRAYRSTEMMEIASAAGLRVTRNAFDPLRHRYVLVCQPAR